MQLCIHAPLNTLFLDSIEEAIRILSSCSDEAKLVGRMPEPDFTDEASLGEPSLAD
jgi:hypothetical protein